MDQTQRGGGVFPLATKIPQVFHRSGKVFPLGERGYITKFNSAEEDESSIHESINTYA